MTTILESPLKTVSSQIMEAYRKDGFVKVEGILDPEEIQTFYEEALGIAQANQATADSRGTDGAILNQKVNVWRESEIMKALTLHPSITHVAKQLAGVPLRLWHDQILAKAPQNGRRTEWHQDQPYWPHANSSHPISVWVALCDVPANKGSMSFIPGAQHRDDIPEQSLSDDRSLFALAPELEYEPKVTLPLRAGDCTFHHGRCPHMANANHTDEYRVAHVAIYIDATTTYCPGAEGFSRTHPVTEPLGLQSGDLLAGDLFPQI